MAGRSPSRPSYRALLTVPGIRSAFAGGYAGRLSYAVLPLSMVLVVRDATGAFAPAGLASGAFSLTATVLGPARARLLDRAGQRPALAVLALAYIGALSALLATATYGGGPALLIVIAGVAGAAAPPLGPAMRVLWGAALRQRAELLPTAYAFDAVVEEVLFTVGPLVAGGLIAVASPPVALTAVIVLVLGGTAAFVSAPATRAMPRHVPPAHGKRRPLQLAGMRTIIMSLAGAGVAVGILEVAMPAFAAPRGSSAAAGVLLALLSAGSAMGGLWHGHRAWRREVSWRYVQLSALLAIALAPLALARTIPQMAVLMLLAGVAIAPLFTCAYLLVNDLATSREIAPTEANTWVSTANNGGAALGGAVAGGLLDTAGVPAALLTACLLAACGTIVAATRRSTLIPQDAPRPRR